MPKALGFLRTNVDPFKGGDVALQRQASTVRTLAAEHGFEVTFVESSPYEGASAAWAELIRLAETGDFEVVLATNVDRLARNFREFPDLVETIDIVTADGIDTRKPEGRAAIGVLISYNAEEVHP